MRVRMSLLFAGAVLGAMLVGASGPEAQRPPAPPGKPGRPQQCAPPATQRIHAPLPSTGWGEAQTACCSSEV